METVPASASVPVVAQRSCTRKLWHLHRRNLHLCCLVITLLIYAIVASMVIAAANTATCYEAVNSSVNETTRQTQQRLCELVEYYYRYFGPPFLLVTAIGYVINCRKCSIRNSFVNRVKGSDAYAHVRQLLLGTPNLAWRVTAYHTEMRTKFVLSFAHTAVIRRKVSMPDRVNTASRTAYFDYSKFGSVDRSKVVSEQPFSSSDLSELVNLSKHSIVKLTIQKKFLFDSNLAERDCERQRIEFFNQLQGLDQHLELCEVFHIEGRAADTEQMTVCADNCPFYMNSATFWILSALLLSWPYRVLIEHRTRRMQFQVLKVFGNPDLIAVNGCKNAALDTRTSSLCTLELDSYVNQNHLVAPAYAALRETEDEADESAD